MKLSIITICFNNLEELIRTCKSVDSQYSKPYEHWIIDGSTNKEINHWLIAHPQPNYRKWQTEADNGIADAFNKGINLATGDILLMLNSGDELADETTIRKTLPHFLEDPALMWVHGKYRFQRAGIWVTLGKPFNKKKLYRGMRSICHQTMYIKKELHKTYGLYNTDLKIAMDFDFLVRIRHEKFKFLPEVLATFSPGGVSMQNMKTILGENTGILNKHIGPSLKQKLWTLRLKLLITILNSPLGKKLYWIKAKLGMANT